MKTYQKFLDSLQNAIEDALDNGVASRLSVGSDSHHITIDIYESKAQMKIFDETILQMAADKNNLELIQND